MDQIDPVEDEWYAVRHSGEMPEVALHAALYYLTEDIQGPRLVLTAEQYRLLVDAATARFRDILLRDLTPENRGLRLFRGLSRVIANWCRFLSFCHRQQVDSLPLQLEVGAALLRFLDAEQSDSSSEGCPSIDCSVVDLRRFAAEIGIAQDDLPEGLEQLCR